MTVDVSVGILSSVITLIVNASLLVWFFATLSQRVKTLERDLQHQELSHQKGTALLEDVKNRMADLAVVQARSDEKLVQLVRDRTLEIALNGSPPARVKLKGQSRQTA